MAAGSSRDFSFSYSLVMLDRRLNGTRLRNATCIAMVIRDAHRGGRGPFIQGVSLANFRTHQVLCHIFGARPESRCDLSGLLLRQSGWSLKGLHPFGVSGHRVSHIRDHISWWIDFKLCGGLLKLLLTQHEPLLGLKQLLITSFLLG